MAVVAFTSILLHLYPKVAGFLSVIKSDQLGAALNCLARACTYDEADSLGPSAS